MTRPAGRRYWRSLEEIAETEEFREYVQREFPANASELLDPVSRRNFLRLMGASLALAGTTACMRQPTERLIPYVRQPEDLVPGKPRYYASAAPRLGYAHGVLVESHMGRPTKIEGNPDHPASLGATDAIVQAEILGLYDPDRSQVVLRDGHIDTWQSFQAALSALMTSLEADGGAGIRLLLPPSTSPTLIDQLGLLRERFPAARVHHFEPAGRDAVRSGALRAFGEAVDVRYHFDRADLVVALDADFLTGMPGSVRYAREFADRRRVRADRRAMSRLYAVECMPTPTGAMADHRRALRPSQIEPVARAIAARLGVAGLIDAAGQGGVGTAEVPWLDTMVEELRAAAGSSVVIAGEQQPAAVHALTHAINHHLGNSGQTVTYSDPVGSASADEIASLADLVDDMNAGAVRFLGMLDCNPVYDAPVDLGFAAALDNVDTRLHVGAYVNETTASCQWHVPQAHFLESWGDLRAFDGTASIVQPLIEPLYGGRSLIEVVGVLRGRPDDDPYDVVRSYWQTARGARGGGGSGETDAAFEDLWRRSLRDGIVAGTRFEDRPVELAADWDRAPAAPAAPAAGTLELLFRPDPTVHDGRYANNGWLQELPKPITLLTWDNAALLSPATAGRLGLANEDEVSLQRDGRDVRAPVWIVPGHPDEVVTIHLGYGRRQTGRVGRGAGFDAYALRTTAGLWSAAAVDLVPTGGSIPLATTQHHHSMEGREPVRVGTLQEYRSNGALPGEPVERPGDEDSLYPPWRYEGDAWGMEIDLNVCMGCNGCMTACQAENNIPVVGKEQVIAGREMHWIRVDRYYTDSLDDPETYFQPVPCMHCENAPCEVVCPVGATVHGDQGLNLMVYNRCVGTRYCSNNCPYKVRRFNFLAFSDADRSPALDLLHNPDVTVRSRGVMEKCTYCLQRINEARIDANKEGRPIADGEIVPACAQSCPTQAITFGNINDPESAVSRLRAEPLHYGLLTELGTRPRTNYLARLRNPSPALATDGEER